MSDERPDEHPHSDEEVDRRFEEMMTDWDGPAAEPIDLEEPEPSAPAAFTVPRQWRAGTGPGFVEEHEEDFQPPAPPPLPKDEGFWATIACLVGGPLWLLYLFFFDRYAAALWWVAAVLITIAGIVLMVVRQPANRDEDDPFDDGARL